MDIGAESVEVQSQMKKFQEKVIKVIFQNVAASLKKRSEKLKFGKRKQGSTFKT